MTTAAYFDVTPTERAAFQVLEVVAWYCRLVLARSRGWLHDTHLPLGTVPTESESLWIAEQVDAAAAAFGYSEALIQRWSGWRKDGLPPLRTRNTP